MATQVRNDYRLSSVKDSFVKVAVRMTYSGTVSSFRTLQICLA